MIRPMTRDDIPAMMELKRSAGWNQLEADWENVLALEPEGCFVHEADGRAVGSATVVRHSGELAWIGMMLVLPAYRRRGIARALMERSIAYCRERRIPRVKLDATDLGRPLYASLGFEDEQPIERWGVEPCSVEAPADPPLESLEEAAALDGAAFGADRDRLLGVLHRRFPNHAFGDEHGYAMSRPGSNAGFLGPAVARDQDSARRLISAALAQWAGKPVFWDLLPQHAAAAELARSLGFQPIRRLVRMALPLGPETGKPEQVWATAGFEYG